MRGLLGPTAELIGAAALVIESLDEVKRAYLEGTGDISVIKKKPDDDGAKRRTAQLGG